jgi:integrase/recombinase XerC
MINSFLEYLTLEKNYSKHTITSYKTDLLAFKDFCEVELELEDLLEVHYNHVRSFVVSLVNQKISNRSINRKLSSLKSFYKFLLKTQQLEVSPLAKHKALKVEKKVQVPFNQKEVEEVLQLLNNQEETFTSVRNKLIVELLYSTGIRRAELISLKEVDVNLQQKTVKVLGKRNKERIIPLLPSVVTTLLKYKELKSEISTNETCFFITNKGNKIYETLVYRIINSYFSQVSTKTKKSPHIVRHSFATHLLNEGANLNSVKELLGHASLASTQVYTHNSLDAIKKVYNQTHPKSRKIK